MRTIDELLAEHPFFAGFGEADLRLIAGCAVNIHVDAGRYLFREGDAADRFFLLRHGRVALEMPTPHGSLTVETVEDDDVLGWSWLVPPYRYVFDARAISSTTAVSIDGACLRGKCEDDSRLGYALLHRVSEVMLSRLQATRVRLLDVYGVPGAAAT